MIFAQGGGLKDGVFCCDDVVIGENSWIGANTVILRGTIMGKNCVVGAGCVIKGSYPDNSIVIQRRETTVKEIVNC
ncbi:DapH/DapD/GlmU-related protein [Adlercreutzia sp. ZJ242]|uniref:DapH/DapD/GlmU-related protein n=1 Tax=Adlercreutzia sp. ZJ242 TaxID=2709409 RepID=UPI00351ABB51